MIANEFISESRVKSARRIAEKLGFNLEILRVKATDSMLENGEMRCYYCKKQMFSKISEFCRGKILDGTNSSDLNKNRPGLKALKEFGVVSPLAELGLSKPDVRKMADFLGLEQIPSDSCLATRINGKITMEKLSFVDIAERIALRVLAGRGFRVEKLRVRIDGTLKVEVILKFLK